MAQRSLHAVTKAYYRSMSCFATDSHTKWLRLQCRGFLQKVAPFAPCGSSSSQRMSQRWVTQTGHPHSTEHDTQPIAYLISKQAIPYQTRGGTCCPGGSTPNIRSLADSSMTSHVTWQNPNHLHHSNLAQTTSSILTMVNSHLDGWETISHKDTSQTQHHKGWKDMYDSHDCMAKHNYPV
jgi:hypothetical protein